MFIKSICVSIFFLFANLCVCFNTKFHLSIPNVDFIAILIKLATCHVRNAFKRPLRPNAPTVRVLTNVILKGIGWAFRKLYPTKIPGMVHQGLLAPQRQFSFFPPWFLMWEFLSDIPYVLFSLQTEHATREPHRLRELNHML